MFRTVVTASFLK